MNHNDVELIQHILEGDDDAFSSLVRKYRKQVHALAWRIVGDFHIAEGNYTRCIPKSLYGIGNLEGTTAFWKLDVRNYKTSLPGRGYVKNVCGRIP